MLTRPDAACLPTIGYQYSLEWYTPYSDPPAGMGRVLMRAFACGTGPHARPACIDRKQAELGFGSGWVICVQAVTPPPKRHTAEQKGKRRVGNLQRRVSRTIGPMFAQEVIDAELTRKADYYAGAEVSAESAAYVAQFDAETGRLWAAFLAWHAAGAQDQPLGLDEAV